MGDTHRNRYKRGDWLADCDRCGFTFFASQLRKEWQGFMVCQSCHEPRHPQDTIRAARAEKPVPWTRPPNNQYVSGMAYHTADGTLTADGSWVADGGSPGPVPTNYVVFGPVDPDSL